MSFLPTIFPKPKTVGFIKHIFYKVFGKRIYVMPGYIVYKYRDVIYIAGEEK